MAWIFEVKNLVEVDGIPVLPDLPIGGFVSSQAPNVPDMFVAYGEEVPGSRPVTRETYAIIHKDSAGRFLVGSPAPIEPVGVSLDSLVDSDPGEWGTYRCACQGEYPTQFVVKDFGVIPIVVLKALDQTPLPIQYLPFSIEGDIVGMKPEAPWSCGDFKASEASSVWYGDKLLDKEVLSADKVLL